MAGKASNADATDCEQCLSGTYVKDNICNNCPAGRYAPTAATNECAECRVGFYTDTVFKAASWCVAISVPFVVVVVVAVVEIFTFRF